MEAAERVFAGEFNSSSLTTSPEDSSSSFIVTPGGAWCSRLFLVGALVEVKGRKGDLMLARVADPTGTFSLRVGWQQQELTARLCALTPPCFIAVSGTCHLYLHNQRTLTSIQVEALDAVDRRVRDLWVKRTAQATLDRLERLHRGLQGLETDQRIRAVIKHYGTTEGSIATLAEMVLSGLSSVQHEDTTPPAPVDARAVLLEILEEHAKKTPMQIDDLIRYAGGRGVKEDDARQVMNDLLSEGECYMPRRGLIKLA